MPSQALRQRILRILPGIWLLSFLALDAHGQTGYPLTPVSGADGVFETVTIDGTTVYRSAGTPGDYACYLYFQANVAVHATTAYVVVTYLDVGQGDLNLQYNATSEDYRETVNATITVRNAGDAAWSDDAGYRFDQNDALDAVRFAEAAASIDDTKDDIPTFGGIFRGRPKTFAVTLQAPATPDTYTTHWGMRQDEAGWFGEELNVTIEVTAPTGVAVEENTVLPATYALARNYPNPFNPATEIAFALPQAGPVRLAVYDMLGREVAVLVDGVKPAGRHTVTFDADHLSSGVYLYRLEAAGQTLTRTMLLLK